jgi:glycosyl hydrolase family 16
MVALWMIGYEDEPERSAEICVCEIFGRDVGRDQVLVGVGVHPFHDPRIEDDFSRVALPIDARAFHVYAADWRPDEVAFSVDGAAIKTVRQSPAYPMQLMLGTYEFPSAERDRRGPIRSSSSSITSARTGFGQALHSGDNRAVPEGLSASEVGKEIGEHARHADHQFAESVHRHARPISIAEAILLSVVALTAAWSGYAAAKWSTDASLKLAKASATRTKANRAYQEALTLRSQDASNFNAWFFAYLSGNRRGELVAERRFRPQYDVAFRAWLATKPLTNPNAPKGPQYMPEYHPT